MKVSGINTDCRYYNAVKISAVKVCMSDQWYVVKEAGKK